MVWNGPGPGVNGEIELSAVKHKDKLRPHYPGKSSKIELSPAPFLGVVTIHLLVQKALAFGGLGCKRGKGWGPAPEHLRSSPFGCKLTLAASRC